MVLMLLVQMFSGCGEQDRSSSGNYAAILSKSVEETKVVSASNSASQSQSFNIASITNDLEDLEDGEFDCLVTNVTRNEGPYTLQCEKDSDEITIHFPNGGYIVTDLDGLHAETGELWQIEEN